MEVWHRYEEKNDFNNESTPLQYNHFLWLGRVITIISRTTRDIFGKYLWAFSENGSYSTWSFQTKLKWINLMPSSNQKLFHSEHDLDEYVAQRYGKGNIQTVSLHYVLEEMWGNHFFWTLEQQALVWNWTEKYFPNEQWDVQMNFIPDKSVRSVRRCDSDSLEGGKWCRRPSHVNNWNRFCDRGILRN